MGWSYRQDQADDIKTAGVGPSTIAAGLPLLYSADGAIAPTAGTAVLTKGSIGAFTLAAPTADGQSLSIVSGSAFAHVVTATSLIQDGVTGGAKTTMTFAAFRGASIMLRAYSGTWNVLGKNAVTVS